MDHVTEVHDWHANNHGYPYRASCSCGWQSRGYVTADAAHIIAADHTAKGE